MAGKYAFDWSASHERHEPCPAEYGHSHRIYIREFIRPLLTTRFDAIGRRFLYLS